MFLIMAGLSEKEIAKKVNRTIRTVKFHKSNILQKNDCTTTREFIMLAKEHKWQFYIPPIFVKIQYIIE
ncbi:transcriptional regulator FimZ [Budvicia aquatica]|uniref:LuxR family transcriptional regulator n=1 Tax=Budvicia aquatica TaxID=82979 RepID=A0A2C6DHR1_9GAMM|nr:LuxR family transcriptional regulator [Budvicia aquatica]VFS48378.1 transcriptional regulator FimZ [Budvicia aquatica]